MTMAAIGFKRCGIKVAWIASLLLAYPAIGATLTAKVIDAAGQPVADAVIYAVAAPGTRVAAQTAGVVVIEQKDREFIPYVTSVQVGTTVHFPNRDPLMHHVYSFSPAKSFEIKLYAGDAPTGFLFDKAGTVTLGCNIHDWMIGYIYVVDTPHFAKTGADGRARIGNIGNGEFEVHVWHPLQRVASGSQPIKLDARTTPELSFTLDAAPRKKKFKPPLDMTRYK